MTIQELGEHLRPFVVRSGGLGTHSRKGPPMATAPVFTAPAHWPAVLIQALSTGWIRLCRQLNWLVDNATSSDDPGLSALGIKLPQIGQVMSD